MKNIETIQDIENSVLMFLIYSIQHISHYKEQQQVLNTWFIGAAGPNPAISNILLHSMTALH